MAVVIATPITNVGTGEFAADGSPLFRSGNADVMTFGVNGTVGDTFTIPNPFPTDGLITGVIPEFAMVVQTIGGPPRTFGANLVINNTTGVTAGTLTGTPADSATVFISVGRWPRS